MSEQRPANLNDAFMLACSLSTWRGSPRACRMCDRGLEGRRVRWCSDECAWRAGREHYFNAGSHHARHEVRKCERCGASGHTATGRRVRLEAHHVEHALGTHGVCSCIHHRSNLEVLCHECHVARHVAERKAERIERDGPPAEQLALEVA